MAAVMYSERPRTPEVVVDETWFSDVQFCEKSEVCGDPCRLGRVKLAPMIIDNIMNRTH